MKKWLIVIIVFIAQDGHSQLLSEKSTTWLADDFKSLRIYKNEIWYNFDEIGRSQRFYMVKDTMIWTNGTPTDVTKFLTIREGDRSLTLTPINAAAKWITKDAAYHFTNIKYVEDPTIKFTRIHLNAGVCYGTCPELSIDIDNKGVYYLKGGQYTDPFNGYFKGKLSARQLDTLNYLIQHSQVEQMQNWKQKITVSDTPPYNLTLYYNSKKLRVSTNWPPINISELITFLTSTYKKVALVPDPEKHEFNEGDDMKYH